MRVLLVILVFYISYVVSAQEKYSATKSTKHLKKVKPFGNRKILIKSGKYVINPKTTITEESGSSGEKYNKYTVFQGLGKSKAPQNIPDSPYFPIDKTVEQKPVVKKALTDFTWPSPGRHKRSAGTQEPKADNKTDIQLKKTSDQQNLNSNREISLKSGSELKVESTSKDDNVEVSKLVKKTNSKRRTQSNLRRKGASKPAKRSNIINKKAEDKLGQNNTITQKVLKNKQAARSRTKKSVGTLSQKSKTKNESKTRSNRKKARKNRKVVRKSKSSGKRQGKTKSKTILRQRKSDKIPILHSNSKTVKPSKKQVSKEGNIAKRKIPSETRRLTAAREALIEDYPYVVSIQKDGQHWCSGALLNPRLVITTANCLWKSNRMSRMVVRAGSSYTDRGGQVAGIQEVMKHPKWGIRTNPDNDVALLLLDTKIRFSHSVHGVDLPNRAMLPAFEDAWVVSWGAERRDGIFDPYENHLQVYHTTVISTELCNNITSRFGVAVTENFICLSQSGKTSPCTRDTGAPAVSDGVLWGLASWGIRKLCGTERFPSMFSYIASHSNMDFIAKATSYLMSEERRYPFLDRPPVSKVMNEIKTPPAEDVGEQMAI